MKSKVVAGVVTVGLVSGMGFAVANTDAGAQLQSWYNGKFNAAGASMQKPLEDYATGKSGYIISEGNKMINGAKSEINETRDSSITTASGNIDSAAQSHIDALQTKEQQISNGIEGQFDSIKNIATGMLNQMAAEGKTQAESYLSRIASGTGTVALGEVQSQLDSAKQDALDDLTAEIERAKSELEEQLNDEKDATVNELKTAIDNKIEEVKDQVQVTLNGYVSTQQGFIQTKASELEAAAKADLDNAVKNGF